MAKKETKSNAELYREERKARIAKANKKNSKKSASGAGSAAKKAVAIILAAVIVLGAGYLIFDSTGAKSRMVTAAKIGGEKISESEFNYYYYAAYQQALQTQENYSQMGMTYIDPNVSPDEQDCAFSEGKTWAQVLVDQAAQQAQSLTAFYNEAVNSGLKLSDEEKKELTDTVANIEESARSNGYSLNSYLKAQFGINKKQLEKQLEKETLASKFQDTKQTEFADAVTEKELKSEFDKNKNNYLLADVCFYALAYDEEADDAAKKDTVKAANDILKDVKDVASFDAAVAAYEAKKADDAAKKDDKADTEKKDDTAAAAEKAAPAADEKAADDKAAEEVKTNLNKDITYSSLSQSIEEASAKWAFAAKDGDKKVIEGEKGAYVVYVAKKADADAHSVSVRYCLIKYNDDAQPAADDKEAEAAKNTAQKLYDDWKKSGDTSLASFEKLCKENSQDTSTSEEGGKLDVRVNQTVAEFEDWCFTEGRKVGDTTVVAAEEYGVFLIYYVSDNKDDLDWKVTAKATIGSNNYSSYVEKLLADTGSYKITNIARVENRVSKDFCKTLKRSMALNSIYGA